MLLLSSLGCQLFMWLGFMDATSCDELRVQEENLDTMMWLKLLFVPTLGVILISLFLLEDYCYSYSSVSEDPKSIPIKKVKNWTEATRLSLIDESGASSCYKIEPSIPMREVLEFYCQRNNASLDSVILRHEGKKILLSETPEQLGLNDLAIIDVETDYHRRYEELLRSSASEHIQLLQQINQEKKHLNEAEHQKQATEKQCLLLTKKRADLEGQVSAVINANSSLRATLSRLEKELSTHQATRTVAEQERDKAERESIGKIEQKERKRLEKELKAVRSELEKLPSLQRKVDALQREKKDLRERSNRLMKQTQSGQTESVSSVRDRITVLTQQLHKFGHYRTDVEKNRELLATYERAATEAAKEVARWKQQYNAIEPTLRELTALRKQVRTVAREAKELRTWQARAKQFEKEMMEANRWSTLAKQAMSREKSLQNEVTDLAFWRHRCITLEQEANELRQWKQSVAHRKSTPSLDSFNSSKGYSSVSAPNSNNNAYSAMSTPSPWGGSAQNTNQNANLLRGQSSVDSGSGSKLSNAALVNRGFMRSQTPPISSFHARDRTVGQPLTPEINPTPVTSVSAKNLPIGSFGTNIWGSQSQSTGSSEFFAGSPLFNLGKTDDEKEPRDRSNSFDEFTGTGFPSILNPTNSRAHSVASSIGSSSDS